MKGFEKMICFNNGILMLIILIWALIRIFINIKNKKFSFKREFILSIFFIYILLIISKTFFPFTIRSENYWGRRAINLTPAIETIKMFNDAFSGGRNYMIKFAFINVLGNLILLAPLSFFIALLWEKFRSLKNNVLFCFITSFSIEFLQFFTDMRTTDIDDLILNTLGAIVGFYIFKLLEKLYFRFFTKDDNMDKIVVKEV